MKHVGTQAPGRLARPGARAAALTALLALIVVLAAPAGADHVPDSIPTAWH